MQFTHATKALYFSFRKHSPPSTEMVHNHRLNILIWPSNNVLRAFATRGCTPCFLSVVKKLSNFVPPLHIYFIQSSVQLFLSSTHLFCRRQKHQSSICVNSRALASGSRVKIAGLPERLSV